MRNDKVEKLVMTALMTALITIVTVIIPIPVPFTNGYIHLGDSMIFLAVIILGWRYGAIAAALGSAFADLVLPYAYWAPWTFVIKGGMALILGFILYYSDKSKVRFSFTCVTIIGFWLLFNVAVRTIIGIEHEKDAAALVEGAGVSQSEFGSFLDQIQSWLMAGSLAIPLLLVVVAIIFSKSKKMNMPLIQVVAMAGSGIFMVFGYYVAGGIIYGNFAVSAFSVPFNVLQFVVGFVIATVIAGALSKTPLRSKMVYYSTISKKAS